MRLELVLRGLEDTARLGRVLGRLARAGDCICLYGGLGAGKTTLTQAIAQGLGVPEEHYVTSPSFALLHEYPGRLPLYHLDCYRLSGADEVEAAGLAEVLPGPGLTVVEWPERLEDLAPRERLDLGLTRRGTAEERLAALSPRGGAWRRRLEEIGREMRP